MLNLINLLDYTDPGEFCSDMTPVLKIVGLVVFGIKVAVPIILIVIGMLDLAKAVTEKSDDNIKKAQQLLIKRAIAAALVFLVATIVGVVMRIVGSNAYKACTSCIFAPYSADCKTAGEGLINTD